MPAFMGMRSAAGIPAALSGVPRRPWNARRRMRAQHPHLPAALTSPPSPPVETSVSGLDAPSNGGTTTAMRHGVKKDRLGRPADQRKALIRALVTEVLRHGRIKTTKTRAKAIRKHVDKMIGLAKDGSLHARRQAMAFVYDDTLVASLFEGAAARYGDRAGGYCRVKAEIQPRRGDGAPMATLELV
jgi:large subunit ribosomal protein L17